MRTAIVLITHRFDAPILHELVRMRAAATGTDRVFVLSDAATLPDTLDIETHRFVYADIASRTTRVVGDSILLNLHLAWLDFFDAHRDFDHYWFAEYDVRYAGPWHELIDAFRDQPHDLLCAHLRSAGDEPNWHWWHEIQPPQGEIERADCIRGFLPITRMSWHGLDALSRCVADGWTGFLEGLIPTALHHGGLQIGDFGGDGRYVPDGFRNRFYTSSSDRDGSLCNLGTHRYRPAIAYPRIVSGRIYHPVKPEFCLIDAGIDSEHAGAAIGNVLEQIQQIRIHRQVPIDTLLQALAGIDVAELRGALDQLQQTYIGDARFARLRERLERLTGMPA